MKVLRSREIATTNSPSKTLKSPVEIEPLTPMKSGEEPFTVTVSCCTTPSPSGFVPKSSPSAESGSGCAPRRSARLSSKSGSVEMMEIAAVSTRKRRVGLVGNDGGSGNGSGSENGEGSGNDSGGKKQRVSDSVKSKIMVPLDLDSDIGGQQVNGLNEDGGNVMMEGNDSGYVVEADGENGFLNLRSGKKILKSSVLGSPSCNDDKLVYEDGSHTGSGRFGEAEKKKGKMLDNDFVRNDVTQVNLVLDFTTLLDNSDPRKLESIRLSREEKGKEKVLEADLSLNGGNMLESDLKTNVEDTAGSATVSVANGSVDNVARRVMETNVIDDSRSTRDYRERFRDIARRNAARFAHFSSYEEEEEEIHVASVAERDVPQEDVTRAVEDWPGPFSTAMKIIRDREANLNAQQPNSSLDKSNSIPLIWVPKKGQQCDRLIPVVPPLHDLCMSILVKHADAITSLESVPDVLRNKLSYMLCGCRKMNNHFLDLLVSGSPTEIRIRDCSWLTEEQFIRSFEESDLSRLTVLQLDQCGRCLPDYILLATLARSPCNLAALTTISLKGACRLSDVGLRGLSTAAPALRSINLSQCSLLTSDGIRSLAEASKLVLKELYIDDCENVDAMLILPALSKLEHLEVLSISGVQNVCDDFVNSLVTERGKNMKEISLAHCMKLTDSSLKAIAENCPGLCAIDLTNLCKLTDSSIGYLGNGCQAIQTLKLCRNTFSDEALAAYLEVCGDSLKILSLNNVIKVANNTALSLAKRSKNLFSLDLSWCRNLTNDAVGLIVDSCSSLKVLKLFGCTQITNVFTEGHSNQHVQVIGLQMSPILQHLDVPEQLGPLHYSSA